MTDSPKVSIITTVLNGASTIGDTIESILAQTYSNFEHIIVDGGSVDGTMHIVENQLERYKGRIKIINAPGSSIYEGMNIGIGEASGDIIGILNSDDYYTTQTVLESLVRAVIENEADAVYADAHYVNVYDKRKPRRYYSGKHFARGLMRFGHMPPHSTFYCRREVYDRFGLYNPDLKIAADFELMLKMIFIGRIKTTYLHLDCVTMRLGGVSTSGLKSHRRILSDHLMAYRLNNIRSNALLDSTRYFKKLADMITFRLSVFFGQR